MKVDVKGEWNLNTGSNFKKTRDLGGPVFDYGEIKARIANVVAKIRESVLRCNPLELLSYCHSRAVIRFREPMKGIRKVESPELFAEMRAAEYIQTCFISGKCDIGANLSKKSFDDIIQLLAELYRLSMDSLFFSVQPTNSDQVNKEDDNLKTSLTALCMYNVRGKRHIAYNRAYLATLLPAHDEILKKLYGIDSKQIIDGFERLVWFLMFGNPPKKLELDESFLDVKPYSADCFDVVKVTGWPSSLAKDLALPCGGETDFFSGDKAGWIFRDTPIKEKPFFAYDGKIYAFSYHIVCDYFYRALQFAVAKRGRETGIKYVWHTNQCAASEFAAEEIFKSLLPGCSAFTKNYYSLDGKWFENDLIIRYSDVLIVVEVKGAAYPHVSPIERNCDLLKWYCGQLGDAIAQCNRTVDYIKRSGFGTVEFSDQTHMPDKAVHYDAHTAIIKIALTVDNVGEIASSTESLKSFATDAKGVICLSLDDLIVYFNNFKGNEALFLHYLKTRTDATELSRLFTYDEMDHLDSYCGNVSYPKIVEAYLKSGTNCFANTGAGCEMDTTKVSLPVIPDVYKEIFSAMVKKSNTQILATTIFLLSFSFEERACVARCIVEGREKARKYGHAVSFRNPPQSRIGLFVTVSEGDNQVDQFKEGCINVATREMRAGLHERFGVMTLIYNGGVDHVEYINVA